MLAATLALLARLQCAAWAGGDLDCQAQWAEDRANELVDARCERLETMVTRWCVIHAPDQSDAGISDCIEARLPRGCR